MRVCKILIGCLLLLCSHTLIGQIIQGVVEDNEGNKIPDVTFLLQKKKYNSSVSEFFTTDKKGDFSYQVKKNYEAGLYIVSSILGYEKSIDSIFPIEKGKVYTLNFTLHPTTTELEEVVLVRERKFRIKNDTVVFNPEAYKDGTERKVEDILKKLPGIEVKGNGRIKYKGKAVAEVQLDGDDLFGDNYTVGTKNISVDIIDAIEAIDNFSKNPLLKGIENSNGVALNLKLKKGKTDYSGNGNVGLGYGDKLRYDIASTLLGVSKKVKSFGVLSVNNIGLNKSSFDYFSTMPTVEEVLNEDLFGEKNIRIAPIKPSIGDARIRLNDEFSGNYNIVQRINPRLKFRYNVFYVKDRLLSQSTFENTFFTREEDISYVDRTVVVQKPEQGRFDVKMDYKLSSKSIVEVESSISQEKISDRINFRRSDEEQVISNLDSEDFFWKNKLLYTEKLNESLVFQFSSLYSRNNVPQSFLVADDFILETNTNSRMKQKSEFRKEVFKSDLSLLGRIGAVKYNFSLGSGFYDMPFMAVLSNSAGQVVSGFQNDSDYKKKRYRSNISINYRLKKWRLSSVLGLNYVRQSFYDRLDISNQVANNQLYPKISLSLKRVFNQTSVLGFKGAVDYITPNENYMFSNDVVTSNRRITNNRVTLDLSKKYNSRMYYRLDDFARSIELVTSIGYSKIETPYLSSFEINDNVINRTNFQAPVANDNLFSKFSISKYIRFLRTTFKHTSYYKVSNFNNVINQSEFRENTSKYYSGDVFFRTALTLPVNFENNLNYSVSRFESSENFRNTNSSIKNTFRVICKPNKSWVFSVFNYYYLPNLKNKSNNNISFLDFSLRYKSQKITWLSGSFVGKNLLNTKFFEQINNSDFSTTVYQSNLIPRYFMVSLDMNF